MAIHAETSGTSGLTGSIISNVALAPLFFAIGALRHEA